jgi:hypothetical protein
MEVSMKLRLLTLSIICIILLFSSSCANKVEDLKIETDKLATEINGTLVKTKEIADTLAKDAQNMLLMVDTYDEPVDDLDESNGGFIKPQNGYYGTVADNGRGLLGGYEYATPDTSMPAESILKEMKLVDKMLVDEFKKYHDEYYYIGPMNYIHYDKTFAVTLNYPYIDALSALPPKSILMQAVGGTLQNLPTFAICNTKNNPSRKSFWQQDLYIHAVSEGVFLVCYSPVFKNENDKDITAQISIQYDINALNENLVAGKEGIYIVITTTGNVFATSNTAKDLFALNLPFWDYLSEFGIKKIGDTFKLTSYDDPGIKELGENVITGEKEFEVKVKNISYTVIVSDIPEINGKVIGMVKK